MHNMKIKELCHHDWGVPGIYIPSHDEFIDGINAYEQRERRGPVYFEALRLIRDGWAILERWPKVLAVCCAVGIWVSIILVCTIRVICRDAFQIICLR